jgi:hypothetical protein
VMEPGGVAVSLPPGTHGYKFLVNGTDWEEHPRPARLRLRQVFQKETTVAAVYLSRCCLLSRRSFAEVDGESG